MKKLEESLLVEIAKRCLNSDNSTELAKSLNKKYALSRNVGNLRKHLGFIKEILQRDDIDPTDMLTLTGATIGKDGEVIGQKLGLRNNKDVDLSGFNITKVTETPFGGKFISYKNEAGSLDQEQVFDRLFNKYNGFEFPKHQKPKKKNKSNYKDNFAILNLYDGHLDKVALKSETGESDNLESNIKRYKQAFDSLLSDIEQFNPNEIIFPIGNDLYHTNGMNGKTKKGTDLQYMCSPEEAYEAITDTMIECVNKLLQVTKVHTPYIAGNHDKDKINQLGYWIPKLFSSNKNFTYNNNRRQRKYVHRGNVLIGLAHGDKEKKRIDQMPLVMSTEKSMEWAKSKKHVWLLGDLHHGFSYKFLKSKDFPSCEVRFLRSIGTSDQYHDENGWIGIPKSAEATIYTMDGTKEYNLREDF